jgi:hypothetical protein
MAGPDPSANKRRPGGDEPGRKGRLTEDMRAEILNRLKAGERAATLAREFGVTRQAVSLLKIKTATAKSRPRLVGEEVDKLKKLATTTRPSDHGFEPPGSWYDQWSAKSLHKLGEKMAKRRLMVLPIRRLFQEWFGGWGGAPAGAYDPDQPKSLATIPEELRDPEFLQFLREKAAAAIKPAAPEPVDRKVAEPSAKPANKKRGRRPSADSLMPPPEAWEFLNAEMARSANFDQGTKPLNAMPPPPIMRTGKHRKSKGSPFTAARKKKKKR